MRELLPWLHPAIADYRRLGLGAVLLLLTAAAAVGLLAVAGWFITATALTGLLIAAGASASLGVFIPGAAIRAFALVRTVARYGERLVNHDTVLRLLARIRVRVFAGLTRLAPEAAARLRTATALNRLTTDIDTLDNLYLRALLPPPVALAAVAGVVGLLAALAPGAAVIAAAALAVTGCAAALLAWSGGAALGETLADGQDRLRAHLLDLRTGLAELRAFGSLADMQREADALDRRLLADRARLARRAAACEAGTTLGIHVAAALTLGAGIAAHQAGTLSGPAMVLLPLAILALGETLATVPGAILELGRTRAAARRLNALGAPADRPAAPDPVPASDTGPLIPTVELSAVELHRGVAGGAPVLTGASLALAAGDRVAVAGDSGAGKSTLADLVAGLLTPDRGAVRIGGVQPARLGEADLRRTVGYLTQRTELFDDRIDRNLRLARPDAGEDELWQALETADLADFVARLPAGLATWIGEGGLRLSGGEARRLALGRVLLADTPVVVLDEPFSGLDAATADRVRERLAGWLPGRTCLLLAHESETFPGVDRRLVLERGRLREASRTGA